MGIAFTSITLNTPNLENMVRFYEILGCKFDKVSVTIGGELFRASVGGIELSLRPFKTPSVSSSPNLMMTFKIKNFEDKIPLLNSIPGVIAILDPTEMPDGKKAILQDPDGRSVELISA